MAVDVPNRKPAHPQVTRWDQQLRAAKNRGQRVRVQLALDAFFADEDAVCTGAVLETDKDGVKIDCDGTEFWINRSFIVGTEIL